MKNQNKVRNSNSKYLSFKNEKERNNFVMLYKDLFVPYSKNGFRFSRYKECDYESKQLLEGYLINPIKGLEDVKCSLMINISANDFDEIKKVLKLKKKSLKRGVSYWSFE